MAETTRAHTLDPENLAPIEAWLKDAIAAESVRIDNAELLPGGAVGENWRISVEIAGGAQAGQQDWVLRTDPPARMDVSLNRADEFAVIAAAYDAGVNVAQPIGCSESSDVIGAPFMIVGAIAGTAQARQIVRDPNLAEFAPELIGELGRELALIHAIKPPHKDLPFLTSPEQTPAKTAIARLHDLLDGASEPRPALEWIVTWLDDNAPATDTIVFCHGDYRTGNYMVDRGKLTGILDWEFAHWGDAREDLGWFCARCWRFGGDDKPAGGIASREELLAAYNAHVEHTVTLPELAYWEILAAAGWGAIALQQGERHLSGREPAIELLLTGMMAPEMELDALQAIATLDSGALLR